MRDQNFLHRTPQSFGRHVKLLVLAAFETPVSRRVDVRQSDVKIVAESLSQHDEKHVVPTPLSGTRVEKRKKIDISKIFFLILLRWLIGCM
jgi:hypothetical protein